MANPYLTNFTKAVPDLRDTPGYHRPMSGTVAGPAATRETNQSPGLPKSAPQMKDNWLEKYGLTMCDFFKRLGKGSGTSVQYGNVTEAKANFDEAFASYEKPNDGSEIKDFAWDCFVQGFEEERPGGESWSSPSGGDDGWGFGTWVLALGGIGAAGLFGYNYLYAK